MINPFHKRTQQEIDDQAVIDDIVHDAELAKRKELAKEHGEFNAQKKYGKFKQPSMISGIAKAVGNVAGNESTSAPKKKKDKGAKERIESMFDQLNRL